MLTRVVFYKSVVKIDEDREIYDTRIDVRDFRRIVQFATDSWSRTEPLKARVYRLEGDLTYETDGKAYQNLFHETLSGSRDSRDSRNVSGGNVDVDGKDSRNSPDSRNTVMRLIRHKRPFQACPCTKDSISSVHDVIRVVYVIDAGIELVLEMIRGLDFSTSRDRDGISTSRDRDGLSTLPRDRDKVVFHAFLNFDGDDIREKSRVIRDISSLIENV